MKIDPTSKFVQPFTDENPPERADNSALSDQDVLEKGLPDENLFSKLIGSSDKNQEVAAEKQKTAGEWNDVAEEVVAGVATGTALVVGVFSVGTVAPAVVAGIATESALAAGASSFGLAPFGIALGISALAGSNIGAEVCDAIAGEADAVADAVSDAVGAVADGISDFFGW